MIAIIGGGRMGRGLAQALSASGERCHLWSRKEATGAVADAVAGADTIILAVPDDAIAIVARDLATADAVTADQVVLHLSGLHGRKALAPLVSTGAALGSLHPLQAVADPETAGARWQGAYAAVEGEVRAMEAAEGIALRLGLRPFRIDSAAKAEYHAAAVMAGNYVVVLAGLAARLARDAGVPVELADRVYLPLMAGAVENLKTQTPALAITGPVRRGDAATVQAHLAALPTGDRAVYVLLGLEALRLAREAGLDPEKATAVERALRG